MQKASYFFLALYMVKPNPRSDCPISGALDIIGDRWSLLIVRDIIMNGKNTYNEFLKSREGIATNILAARLAKLEEEEIIIREEHPESKAKIFYRLTEKGIDLLPVIIEMILWSGKYLPVSPASKVYATALKNNKEAILQSMLKTLKKNRL